MRLLAGLMRLRQLCCDSWLCLEDYAGGTGLNLVGADAVIHYDPWWNAAAFREILKA